jgi:hypothetical protein
MEETEKEQVPALEEMQDVEEEEQDEGAEEEETVESQALDNTTQEKFGPKPKPKPSAVREPGKSLLPLARVQRIMKADKVRPFSKVEHALT